MEIVRKVRKTKRISDIKCPEHKRKNSSVINSHISEAHGLDWIESSFTNAHLNKTSSPKLYEKIKKNSTATITKMSPIKLTCTREEHIQGEYSFSENDSIFAGINLDEIDIDYSDSKNLENYSKNVNSLEKETKTLLNEKCSISHSSNHLDLKRKEETGKNCKSSDIYHHDADFFTTMINGCGDADKNHTQFSDVISNKKEKKTAFCQKSCISQRQSLKNNLQNCISVSNCEVIETSDNQIKSHSTKTVFPLNYLCNKSTSNVLNDSKIASNFQFSEINNERVGSIVDNLLNVKSSKPDSENNSISSSRESTTLQSQIQKKLLKNANISNKLNNQETFHQAQTSMLEALAIWEKPIESETVSDGPFYGLPLKVKDLFSCHRKIEKLYDWQDECLTLSSVHSKQNLIYSLPTSGGKTLVAEILILQELLYKKQDVLLILPFVSIVQEKVRDLTPFASELNFFLHEYAGGKGGFPLQKHRKRRALYIATIEKAHMIINSLIENQRLHVLGLVIVDELHMLGEPGGRGAILESTIAKIMYGSKTTRIIAMSATLGNINDLTIFLKAHVYSHNFRPIELVEYLKIDENIFKINTQALDSEGFFIHQRVFNSDYTTEQKNQDPDQILALLQEVIPQHSCLVFCASKKNCENLAYLICKMLPKSFIKLRSKEKHQLKKDLLLESNGKICPILKKTVLYGLAYHHSGLTAEERRLIEEGYRNGVLCVIMCTSTLAAGVNLPAKRVILRSPYIGKNWLTFSKYKQMVGRAGRMGLDTSGESILIIKSKEQEKVLELLNASYDNCISSLMNDNRGLQLLILSSVGLGITNSKDSINSFLENTLLYIQRQLLKIDLEKETSSALNKLIELGLIKEKLKESQESNEDKFVLQLEVTKFGRAIYKGGVSIDCCLKLYEDLKNAIKGMVLCNHLHLLYVVTPYEFVYNLENISPMTYYKHYSSLSTEEMECATAIGVTERCIVLCVRGQKVKDVDDFVVKRFYLTLMLYQLWNNTSIWDVAEKFEVSRGFVQMLLSSAAVFASSIFHFCEEMDEFWALRDLLEKFSKRLHYCVKMELIPLMEISGVKQGRAQQLYQAGYRTVQDVANALPDQLVYSINHLSKKLARNIVASAKLLLKEKAIALWEEAEDLLMAKS